MNYYSGQIILLGDKIKYNGQDGCIALIGRDTGVGCSGVLRSDWDMKDAEIFILFDNGARLILNNVSKDDLLVFCKRA